MESKKVKKKIGWIKKLKRGDIVRHRITGNSYVIDGNYGLYAIAIKSIQISNPNEWIKVKVIKYKNLKK